MGIDPPSVRRTTKSDHSPPSWLSRVVLDPFGLWASADGMSMRTSRRYIRTGEIVWLKVRVRKPHEAELRIGDLQPRAVTSGWLSMKDPSGDMTFVLRDVTNNVECVLAVPTFDTPELDELRWSEQLVAGRPVTLMYRLRNVTRCRLQIEQQGTLVFDSDLPSESDDATVGVVQGNHVTTFNHAGAAVVRLIAETPGAPWPDTRRKVFSMSTPVHPAHATCSYFWVQSEALVGQPITIRWRVVGTAAATLCWTHAGATHVQTLPAEGETSIVATQPSPIDLSIEPKILPFTGEASAVAARGADDTPICRRIKVRARPPRIEVDVAVVRGRPRSKQSLPYRVEDATQAFLARPNRAQNDKIELAGVMSFLLGDEAETLILSATSEFGGDTSRVINLRPRKGLLRRIFDAYS